MKRKGTVQMTFGKNGAAPVGRTVGESPNEKHQDDLQAGQCQLHIEALSRAGSKKGIDDREHLTRPY